MKCSKCGFENKDKSKFCTKCGSSLNAPEQPAPQNSNNSKYIIIALLAIIVILVATIGYFSLSMNTYSPQASDNDEDSLQENQTVSDKSDAGDESESQTTQAVSSSKPATTAQPAVSKSWESIGSYSGSGSGSQTITVPEGQIKIELSAYPIKNYADNHLYVSGTNGKSGGVDWGSNSAVETRSDSFEYTSSGTETFTIDYYETVSWQVDFYRYQ